ncbi:MAG: hypothetical protein LBS36_01105 [Oscillospiraceae bacterium]|jgi:hypothetical protein|nr:hypothetical protein [Oscillospiraceae bacterium]
MIKGVNRQVLELNDTGNEYFEKAIFFVKPEYSGLGEGKLRERAKIVMKNAGNPPRTKREESSEKLLTWIKFAAVGSAGAAVSAIVCLLLTM